MKGGHAQSLSVTRGTRLYAMQCAARTLRRRCLSWAVNYVRHCVGTALWLSSYQRRCGPATTASCTFTAYRGDLNEFFCLPGRRVGRYGRVVAATMCFSLSALAAHAQTCPFDDGNSSLTVEGVILTRYALGITGAPLVASTGIAAADAPSVEATINCPSCGLNITGNPTLTVADATIISRKLAGFSGAQLTDGLALGSGTRNTPAAVQSFLLAGCGATGGTVTSITAGSGLTGGRLPAAAR